jgi:hypothetical protein
MVDTLPLDVLFNGDAGECTSVNIAQLLDDAIGSSGGTPTPPPVEVTLRDADGSIVGTQTLPKRGGTFSKATGCDWTLEFPNVPARGFYEATVAVDGQEWKGTGQAEPATGQAAVQVQF